MNLLLKELVLSVGIFAVFILTSEGKYQQHVGASNILNEEDKEYENRHGDFLSLSDYEDAIQLGHIVKRSTGTSSVYTAICTESSPPGPLAVVSAYVDDTMTGLIFQAEVKISNPAMIMTSNPVIIITQPSGIPFKGYPSLNSSASTGVVIGTVEINITATNYGTWKFTKLDNHAWDVTIKGESPVDFSYKLTDYSTGMTVNKYPIQGKTYKIEITVQNFALMKHISNGLLFVKERSIQEDWRPLKDNGGGKYEFTYTLLNQTLYLGIQGEDKSNHVFQRLSPKAIIPVSLNLTVPPYTGVKLHENTDLNVDFTVVNIGSAEQDIDVRIEDDKGFARAPLFISATIKPGENFTGHFILRGGNYDGEIVTAKITARQYLGHGTFGPGPSEIRLFTVEINRTTTSISTTATTTVTQVANSSSVSGSVSTGPAGSTVSQAASNGVGAGSATNVSSATNAVAVGGSNLPGQPLPTGAAAGVTQTATVPPGALPNGTVITDGSSSKSGKGFNKGDVLTAAVVSGISGGTLVGIAGLVVMGLLFRGVMKKFNPNSVSPEKGPDGARNQNFGRKNVKGDYDFTWT